LSARICLLTEATVLRQTKSGRLLDLLVRLLRRLVIGNFAIHETV
jgi:hypothetical protein